MSATEPPRGFTPASRVAGELVPPGSKSEAQRALLAALFASGETRLTGVPAGEDVVAALALARDAGGEPLRLYELERAAGGPQRSGDCVRVLGLPPARGGPRTDLPLGFGESGTLARLATAMFALATRPESEVELHARGSLLLRRSSALFTALQRAGIQVLKQNVEGTWPVRLRSTAPPAIVVLEDPRSSQEVSGLLLALAAWAHPIALEVRGRVPSLPYIGLTRALLARFGARVEESVHDETHRTYRVEGPLTAPAEPLALEPDASSAAVALAAACLTGGRVAVPGLFLGSAQGDVRVVEHLQAFGSRAGADERGLFASGFPTRGAMLDLAGEPDLAPVLAAVAAGAALRHEAATTLAGLGTLPGKESDRLRVLASGLDALGLEVERGAAHLRIAPGGSRTRGAVSLDPEGDHRMAFAFALFGFLADDVQVRGPGCVAKSWPSFWDDLERLGAVALAPAAG